MWAVEALAVVQGCSRGDRKHLLGLHKEKNDFRLSPPRICSSYVPLKLFCQLCLLIYHHQLFLVLWTDIFLDSKSTDNTMPHMSYLSYD